MTIHSYTAASELTAEYMAMTWNTLPSHIHPTTFLPCPCPALSDRFHCNVTIATETFQYTGSFKFRAAYNLLSNIPQTQVIAASSGNFGQAVAYASQLLGKQCTIVMPDTSAQVKIEAVQAYGGIADLIDVRKIGRDERVMRLLQDTPDAFRAQAYDDYRVVVGNSTLGKEILQSQPVDCIIVPIGGGGLSSGIVIARDYLNTSTEVIGAEPLLGNDATRSIKAGQLIHNEYEPATIADGARTIGLGTLNWEILQHGITDIIEVPDEQIIKAVQHSFRYANLKVEPTGALSLAAILLHPERFEGKRVCCIISGGNVDPAVYARILTTAI